MVTLINKFSFRDKKALLIRQSKAVVKVFIRPFIPKINLQPVTAFFENHLNIPF